jgi:hypothetical protein
MTPDERKASIEATATERAATLNPPVVHQTLADLHKRVTELEGKPFYGDPTNDFHLKGNAIQDMHGISRAKFIQKLTSNNLVDEASLPLFLKFLNEYEADDSGDPPYDVAKLAEQGQALNYPLDGSSLEKYLYTEHWDTGFAQDGDPYGIQAEYVSQSPNPNAKLPTQAQADAIANQAEFEQAAYHSAGVDVRPSEEKVNG